MRKLIKSELLADAKKYGDARRSPLVARDAAVALSETELTPSEAMTVILSEKGWVRAAKGHDVSAETMSYRDGDKLLATVNSRSNQQVAFIDSTGRSFSTSVHTLPSARGNGEPLTGRFSPSSGASFVAMAAGDSSTSLLLATSHGYGFVTSFDNLLTRQKAGKGLLNLTPQARVLSPFVVGSADHVAVVTSAGHLLVYPLSEVPALDKGKGNKLIEIPKAKLGTEQVVAVAALSSGPSKLLVHSGARVMTLSWSDLQSYIGRRATRGGLLPRGWQKVDGLSIA